MGWVLSIATTMIIKWMVSPAPPHRVGWPGAAISKFFDGNRLSRNMPSKWWVYNMGVYQTKPS